MPITPLQLLAKINKKNNNNKPLFANEVKNRGNAYNSGASVRTRRVCITTVASPT